MMNPVTPGRSGNVVVWEAMKSRTVLSLMVATFMCLLSGCSRAQQLPAKAQPPSAKAQPPSAKAQPPSGAKKILIVYLSRTGNTKAVAEFIHQTVGGTMVPLELETPYPAGYNATVQQVVRENETGYLPPLKTKIERIEQYDYVFLGFPTWGMQLPPPMKSFLRRYSMKGKTVIPFNTNAGYGEGRSFQTVRELCPQSTVMEGFVTRGGIERDGQLLVIKETRAEAARKEVENWLRKIKLLR
jgi:flavodoxin